MWSLKKLKLEIRYKTLKEWYDVEGSIGAYFWFSRIEWTTPITLWRLDEGLWSSRLQASVRSQTGILKDFALSITYPSGKDLALVGV